MARTINAAPNGKGKTKEVAPPVIEKAVKPKLEKSAKKQLPAVRKSTEVGDWKAEMEKYAVRAQATATLEGGNWFSVRGGRLAYKGAELEDSQVDAILLDSMMENAFYEGLYDPENPKPPVCFAFGYEADEMKPHEQSTKPQNENCATCEHNKFGSAENSPSGRGKACKNIRRIAFISGEDITAHGIEDAEIGKLKVPVTSVANLSAHINSVRAKCGGPPFVTVTRIHAEPDAKRQVDVTFGFSDPKKPVRFPDKLMPVIIARVKEAEKLLDEPYTARAEETNVKPARSKKTANGGKRKF